MKTRVQRGASLALFTVLSLSERARADGEARAEQAARAAFEAGRELAATGNYDEACSKFQESMALVDAIGTTYNLADCEEHRGHFARAQSLFLRVAERAHQLEQPEREQAARERMSALDTKLSLLAIEQPARGAALSLDGQPLSVAAAKAPIPVEPGKHRLSASAKGKRSWSKLVDIPRAQLLVTVSVPKLGEVSPPTPSPRPTARPEQPSSAPALVLGSIGVGATLTGAFFGWRYLTSNADAKATCPSGYGCGSEQIAEHGVLVDRARASRTYSYVGFGVGAAALTGAAVFYFTGRGQHELSASATTGGGAWTATVQGKF